jgi:ABC-2 type transport system ATP-binding protein
MNPSAHPAIAIRNVTKDFKSAKSVGAPSVLRALDGVDLTIQPGEFFALLGPNGAGKTTLISALAGLTRPTTGTLAVMGHDVVRDFRAARVAVGIVPQEIVFDPFFSVRETLRLQSGYFGIRNNDDWIDELLAKLALTSKADANMRALSGGMKRRVMVAQALVHRPPVIVLDEPTAGVDVELRQTLWAFIRELNASGHTILLTTHYLEEAQQLCQRIAMLKAGRVVALDTTTRLLAQFSDRLLKLKLASGQIPEAIAPKGRQGPGDIWQFPIHDLAEVDPILGAIRAAGGTIGHLELTEPDLEEVFLKIMAKAA